MSLPAEQDDLAMSETGKQSFVAAMKPRRDGIPVIAVLALNEGTETTDLLLPYAVLQRARVADVQIVAPRRGAVTLFPALQVEGAQDLESFDQAHPSGADYVIVPAMVTDDNASVTSWLRRQAGQGARVIGICSGALVVAQAGLLDGRRFTGHWYDRGKLLRHPGATYVANERYLADRGVATTTGISASIPTTLALVEAIAGRPRAQDLGAELGVTSWNPVHNSASFGLNAQRRWNFLINKLEFWRHERRSIEVHEGIDDIALALASDAWSRTGHVSVEAAAAGPVTMRSGLVLSATPAAERLPHLSLASDIKPVHQLDHTLCEIAERYGAERREWVMQEMEYSGEAGACAKPS